MKAVRFATGVTAILIVLLLGPFCSSPAAAAEEKGIIKIGSDVTIGPEEKVRSVVVVGGQITVEGQVERHVVSIGGSVVLTKTATVGGNVVAVGGVIVAARSAEVEGTLTEINSSNIYDILTEALSSQWEGWSWLFAIANTAIFLVILTIGLLAAALLPKPLAITREAIQKNTFKVVLWGLLGLVLIAPLALLLTISVVGIALIPLEIIVVVCSVLLGLFAVGGLIGSRFLRIIRRPRPSLVRETFWGLVILWLVGWIPYLGWMIKALAIVVGLGAALITRFGTHRSPSLPPYAPAAWPPCPPSSPSVGADGEGI